MLHPTDGDLPFDSGLFLISFAAYSPQSNRTFEGFRSIKKLALVSALLVVFASFPSSADRVRERSELIRSADHSFIIDVGGTLDPENIEIAIENTGSVPAVNPRITVNGRYNWYTLEGLTAEVIAGCRTEEEKVWAIFQFIHRESYWWPHPKDLAAMNPVRHFNTYGYHICSMAAAHFTALCRAVGIEARIWEIYHHTVAEAFWDGAWHVMDADMGMWFLKGDNRTVASMADLQEHPEWVSRTYKPPRFYFIPGTQERRVYRPEADPTGDEMANWYATRENNYVAGHYDAWAFAPHSMDITLRPGEKLVRWWTPALRKHYDQKTTQEPPRYANGQIIFEPDFKKFTYEGSLKAQNLAFYAQDGTLPAVHVRKTQDPVNDQPSRLSIPMRSPYVMVGGHIDTRYYKSGLSKLDKVALSADLDPHFYNFTPLWDYWAVGLGDCRAVLDDKMFKDGMQATYEMEIAYTISADAAHRDVSAAIPLVYGGQSGLDAVRVVVDLQLNPGSLPALSLGKNVIRYKDESGDGREVKVTYKWRERQGGKPEAPAGAIFPKDGALIDNPSPRFEWKPARSTNGSRTAAYRFQLSLQPDCAWPLSPNFDREIRGSESLQTSAGWLNPGITYYWRVAAEDENGNVGLWSKVFSFTVKSTQVNSQ